MDEEEKKKNRKMLYIIGVISYIGNAICYFFMTKDITVNWNVNWEADTYIPKEYIFLLGLVPIVVLVLFQICGKVDPKYHKFTRGSASLAIERIVFVLMLFVAWMSALSGIDTNLNFKTIGSLGFGILFVILGNYLPTVRQNYFIGIRTPWTLSDEMCFRKTNRFGGYVFVIIGILMMLGAVIQTTFIYIIAFAALIIGSGGTIVYSYLIYQKLHKRDNS